MRIGLDKANKKKFIARKLKKPEIARAAKALAKVYGIELRG
jgi:hypothetical protein